MKSPSKNDKYRIYTFALVAVPIQDYTCFGEFKKALQYNIVINATNLRNSTVKRMTTMNLIAHELVEMVASPIPWTGWTATTKKGAVYENADICHNTYLNLTQSPANNDTTINTNYEFQVNGNTRRYLIQSTWDINANNCT
jgi:hypothetical protein